jgi:hypothetical protein
MTERSHEFDALAELEVLLVATLLGDAASDQLDRLNELLLGDQELRWHAARFLEEEAMLRRQFEVLGRVGDFHSLPVGVTALTEASGMPACDLSAVQEQLASLVEDEAKQKRSRSRFRPLTIAAALAASLALAMILGIPANPPMPIQSEQARLEAAVPPAVLAEVVLETTDCEWSLDHHTDAPRGAIRSGDMIRVAKGKMRLNYSNGVVLTLHGPALFEVISDMRGRALLGRLTAKIAKGAEGFSVLTPRATVIDLGTELGIEVDDAGATDVVVFEGSVDLNYRLQDGGAELQRRLFTGEAMRLDPYGTISRIVSISNQRFSDDLLTSVSESPQEAIISSVRDNIQRETAWNYYEIVRGGMGEDARAYVDRQSHEWNGLDESGMPAYLIGGDYVKTFNNDKCRKDIEIIVTIDAPCKMYILLDDRISPPQWLRDSFRDTGDKIGIDGGPWIYNGVLSQGVTAGVGPGVSVDDKLSVWVRTVESPGPVRLGATETPHDDLNMYGIVAVPLTLGE